MANEKKELDDLGLDYDFDVEFPPSQISMEGDEPAGVEQEEYDPFDGAGGTAIATLITTMRIYDVLLALLAEEDEETSNALREYHASGGLVTGPPILNV